MIEELTVSFLRSRIDEPAAAPGIGRIASEQREPLIDPLRDRDLGWSYVPAAITAVEKTAQSASALLPAAIVLVNFSPLID
jgi:hypothetical protein